LGLSCRLTNTAAVVYADLEIVKKKEQWFSRYVIAAMLMDGKQKIAH